MVTNHAKTLSFNCTAFGTPGDVSGAKPDHDPRRIGRSCTHIVGSSRVFVSHICFLTLSSMVKLRLFSKRICDANHFKSDTDVKAIVSVTLFGISS